MLKKKLKMDMKVNKFADLYYNKNIVGITKEGVREPLKVVYDEYLTNYFVLSNYDELDGLDCGPKLRGDFTYSWVISFDHNVDNLLRYFTSIVVVENVLRRV